MTPEQKKAWKYFWAPINSGILYILGGAVGIYLVVAGVANITYIFALVMGLLRESEPLEWWWLPYSGWISWAWILIFAIYELTKAAQRHYKGCLVRVYREEHNIPKYCSLPEEHRLHHTIGEICPCKD